MRRIYIAAAAAVALMSTPVLAQESLCTAAMAPIVWDICQTANNAFAITIPNGIAATPDNPAQPGYARFACSSDDTSRSVSMTLFDGGIVGEAALAADEYAFDGYYDFTAGNYNRFVFPNGLTPPLLADALPFSSIEALYVAQCRLALPILQTMLPALPDR